MHAVTSQVVEAVAVAIEVEFVLAAGSAATAAKKLFLLFLLVLLLNYLLLQVQQSLP